MQLNSAGLSAEQVVVLASIIEKETNRDPEKPDIAGVYLNRLRKGWPLQADPTIIYAWQDYSIKRLTAKHLKIDSKYNTYKYEGLPPSPINNPGKDAIMAALFPEKHKYLYFVVSGKTGHIFSATYEQHQINVAKYRRWLKNQD